ncbi:unnamed protein product, partial [Thelazia callipaeda]|uniref:MSP domain-containing protein n=1 Tax=Thelazia callipaeda TaxID=103827 RepID=A0A0N5CNM2_THECL
GGFDVGSIKSPEASSAKEDSASSDFASSISEESSPKAGIEISPPTNLHEEGSTKDLDLSTKVLIPVKDHRRVEKVEEKVVEENKSARTISPRRRKATLLHFARTNELPNVARVQLLLSNISDRPLRFKLKCEPGSDISALPSAKGRINGHGSSKCTLTWRREPNVEQWSQAQRPKMLLVLDFLGDKTRDEKRTLTRLIGEVVPGLICDSNKPPVEQLMLDAVSSDYFRSKSREMLAIQQAHTPACEPEKRLAAESKSIVDDIIDWFGRQSKDSLLGLLLLMIFFYFLGMSNCSKQDDS